MCWSSRVDSADNVTLHELLSEAPIWEWVLEDQYVGLCALNISSSSERGTASLDEDLDCSNVHHLIISSVYFKLTAAAVRLFLFDEGVIPLVEVPV